MNFLSDPKPSEAMLAHDINCPLRVKPYLVVDCENCNNQRWVCENHSDQPWNDGDPECCGGAGAPCGKCNSEFPHVQLGTDIFCVYCGDLSDVF